MPERKPFPICDLHCDTALRLASGEHLDQSKGHLSLAKMESGGVGLQVFACWISPRYRHRQAWFRTLELITAAKREISRHSGRLMLAISRDSWLRCSHEGRIGIMLAVEGGHALDGDVGRLEHLYDQGVRMLTLTWNNSNHFACSAYRAHKSGRDGGLTALGRRLVSCCDRLGIRLDLSHASPRSFWEVMDTAQIPPLLSHSCVKFLNGHFRNAADNQIRALASRGGLMGINFCPAFLGPQRPVINIDSVADQFEYVKELAGNGLLAIGSDFDGIRDTPQGLAGPDKLPDLLDVLRSRGFTRQNLDDIGCGNFLRYLGWQ